MALQFNPYPLEPYLRKEEERRGPDFNQSVSNPILQGLQMLSEQRRQDALLKISQQKEGREAQQFASEYGSPIDPNMMIADPTATVGKSSFMPGGQGQVGTGVSLIDKFNRWKAGGMKVADARGEYMPALGKDERKMFYENANPKPVSDADIELKLARAAYLKRTPAPASNVTPNGKQLPPASILAVNEGKTVARMMPEVEQALQGNSSHFGPAMGRIGQMNPYDTTAQTVDARMRTASQAFGRFMEGGVLRKEDEEKYRKMFPQLSDTPDVAQNKLSIVRRLLAQQYQSMRQSLGDSGYDVSGLGELEIPASIFDGQESTDSPTRQFRSLQEAEGANLPIGTRIMIGGRSATVR